MVEYRKVSDEIARKEIKDYITQQKEQGLEKIGTLDMIFDLSLPGLQIEKIMESLNGIKEIN